MTRTLVFAHANGVPGGSYRRFLAGLEPHFSIAAPNHLGRPGTIGKQWVGIADELEQIIEPLPKPVVGMGHSMGAVATFILATRHPHWFSALVMLDPPLINGWAKPVMDLMYLFRQMDRVTPAGKSRYRRAYWPDWAAVEDYFEGRGMFRHFHPDCLRDYLAHGLVQDDTGWHLRIPPAQEVEVFTETPRNLWRYPRLRIPGLLVNGENTENAFVSTARRHARRHQMTHLRTPGTHMFPLEHPDETAETVLEWLLADVGDGAHA